MTGDSFPRGNFRRLLFPLSDMEHKTINTLNMIMPTFCNNIFCTTVVRMDRAGHAEVQKRAAPEKAV